MEKRIALVTGASSGIGASAALKLQQLGFRVYGAARRLDKMKGLEEKGISIISMDITKEESVQNCVNTILEKEGSIDVLINNAGYGSYGAVEDVPMEEARRQFDVNNFGLAYLTQLVLPSMRKNKFGKIVNISSMAGKVYTPFGAWYHASKHALEAWSDCLRLEVKPFGIDVVIVEPGGIKTPWGTIAADNLRKTSGSGAYSASANNTADKTTELYTSDKLTPADDIGKVIVKAVTANKPKRRYVKGYGAKLSIFIRKWFGDGIYEAIIKRVM